MLPDQGKATELTWFHLEVGIGDADLLEIAERSRMQSGADLMAANTLEGMNDWAYVGAGQGNRTSGP